MGVELLIAGGAGLLAAVILIAGIVSLRSDRQSDVEERLGRYTSEYGSLLAEFQEAAPEEQQPSMLTQRLDSALAEREFAKKWRAQLSRADLKLTVGEYFALHLISGVGVFLVSGFLIFGNPFIGIVAGIGGLFIPRVYVSRLQGKRLRDFEDQLPDTLSLWVNALRSGFSVLQAMESIGKESPEPTATEFRRVVQEVQLGVPMEGALDHLYARVPSADLDLIITAVNIQREVGGNLAEILDSIGHTIRDRIKLKGEIRVLTSQGRATGWLISLLPIGLVGVLMVVSPGYITRMFTNRMCGWPMLGCGAGLIAIGSAVIQKIVQIDY